MYGWLQSVPCLTPLSSHTCSACVEYVLEFQKCLDRTDPIPYATIRGIMQQELKGRSIESIFSYINPEPLASASVAQVGVVSGCACQGLQVVSSGPLARHVSSGPLASTPPWHRRTGGLFCACQEVQGEVWFGVALARRVGRCAGTEVVPGHKRQPHVVRGAAVSVQPSLVAGWVKPADCHVHPWLSACK